MPDKDIIEKVKKENRALTQDVICSISFQIILPIAFGIALFFPFNHFLNVAFMYERVMASADLILISAILFISITNDIYMESNMNSIRGRVEYAFFPMLLVSIMWFVLFAVCKLAFIKYTFPQPGGNLSPIITKIATVSLMSVVAAAVTAFSFKIYFYSRKKLLISLKYKK